MRRMTMNEQLMNSGPMKTKDISHFHWALNPPELFLASEYEHYPRTIFEDSAWIPPQKKKNL